jgi:cob(I)alamin adenosyltransferase
MKIYTKTGDSGTTSLIGGKRVPKFHERIEAYGTIDELICHVGLLRDLIQNKAIAENLIFVQNCLMTCATILATDDEGCNIKPPKFSKNNIKILEKGIDKMEKHLIPLKSLIIPGGHPTVSQCHITRAICRRAERKTLALSQNHKIDPSVLMFLNRLSDYFFVLARYYAKLKKADEMLWNPNR